MAHSNRLAKSYLAELEQAPQELFKAGFAPLVRYLEANAPLAARVGYSVSPKYDFARFGQQPLLHFFPSAFAQVKYAGTSGNYKIKNSYIGFLGINGPLPIHLTEYAIERRDFHRDHTFGEFLDVFNHRFISLFYRAWADSQPSVSHDRVEQDHFKDKVAAIAGKPAQLADTFNQQDNLHHYLAGLLSHKNHSGKVLTQLLAEYLQLPVDLTEFEGKWFDMPSSAQTKLGLANGALGVETIIGNRTFQRSFSFSVNIGPVSLERYMNLINNDSKFNKLIELTRNFVGFEYEFSIKIYLKAQQSRPAKLGMARLGYTSWSQDVNGHLNQETALVFTKEC